MDVGVLISVAALVAGMAMLASWMLAPINRVAGHLRLSTRFVLTDVLGLMALLQLPLAVAGKAIESSKDRDNSPYWTLLGVGVALAMVLWAAAVSVVSRAGITRLGPRLCVMIVLVPGSLAVMILVPVTIISVISGAMNSLGGPAIVVLTGLAMFALAGAALTIRWLSFWSLRGSPGEADLASLLGGSRATPAAKMLARDPRRWRPGDYRP